MRLALFYAAVFFSTVSFIACHHDKVPEPATLVTPRPYFPVYPGSWWKYEHNGYTQSDTVLWTTSPDYELRDYQEKTYKVPLLYRNSTVSNTAIHGYQEMGITYLTYQLQLNTFLSEDVGFTMISHVGDPRYSPGTLTEVVTEKSANRMVGNVLYDSVIVVHGQITPDGPGANVFYKYYAKNIGLVRDVAIDSAVLIDTFSDLRLIDYHINH